MKYIVNWTSYRVHMTDDEGRTFEACNIDQIKDREDYRIDPTTVVRRFKKCLRCFRETPTNSPQS